MAAKFHLTLVVPLILVSIAVGVMTLNGLQDNASHLSELLRIESKTNRILSLLLVQDDASKAILIDPNQLEIFSAKKIEAYDAHKQLLIELQQEVGSGRFQELIQQLQEIDEQKLRPIDTQVLEKLFEDVDQARRMYFDQYETHKKEYERLIRELAAIGVDDLNRASEEMHKKNMQSLVHIALTLLLGIVVIAVTITILSRHVEKSDRNTKSLLDVLSEGLFFFDGQGTIAEERSQTLQRILPETPDMKSLYDFIQRYAPASSKNVEVCLRMLWADNDPDFFSDISTTLSMLPRSFVLPDHRIIELDYRPLRNAKNELERVVVVVADVTQKLQQEREAKIQAERVKKITRAAARLDDYLAFLDEARLLVQRANQAFSKKTSPLDAAEDRQVRRDLHTLKGTLATADFSRLAAALHQLETLIEDHGISDPKVMQQWQEIVEQWTFETADIDHVLGLSQRTDRVHIARAKFQRIHHHASTHKDSALQTLLLDCLRQPASEIFARYQDYLGTTADKLAKQVKLSFAADSAEIAPFEVQKLDAIFNHILRNSVDHGIEEAEVRVQQGKPPQGVIQWTVVRSANDRLRFIIQDDGQGVNGAKLAQKAVQAGLWSEAQAHAANEQQKVELLFLPQLSSRDEVTELSGRGVGMDAVKELVQKLGGSITVRSQPGQGTRFEIEIPAQDSASPDSLRRSA
ncbi:MAG TPA: ATP-binding protein [Oligoflexus sp.]|uniref:ATP-binding protein n=1 Tax=Oligoflexus sp. TaxID=1971216 RepID=UPI002D4300A8|nr:ATP-binding protein [Oligoflexus sp.]HYX31976.1 ATP-binding protein [Oligoflexus sp.]